jgi:hypothetical protein
MDQFLQWLEKEAEDTRPYTIFDDKSDKHREAVRILEAYKRFKGLSEGEKK